LINWVWTLALLEPSGFVTGEFERRLMQFVYLHLREIAGKYSQWSSANNHLIGEAAGVFIASAYFNEFKNAAEWNRTSRELLCREILAQTYADGGTREQAFGYHLFVTQFFTFAGIVARAAGEDFP